MFEALGAIVFRYRWLTLLASAAFLALAVGVLVRGGTLTSGVIHGLESETAQQLVDAVTGHPADTTFVVVLHADGLDAHDPAFTEAARGRARSARRRPPRRLRPHARPAPCRSMPTR